MKPDPTEEDYALLARRSWYRGGTGKWDEAVLACAERHSAAILTRDQRFHEYVSQRTDVTAWLPQEFVRWTKQTRPPSRVTCATTSAT